MKIDKIKDILANLHNKTEYINSGINFDCK